MPLINGCKYSCEPCIRGHRSTSCAHTDRILVEVRKPGRPLESCGHGFSTCTCGKLAGLISLAEDPTLETREAKLAVVAPTPAAKPKSSNPRVQGKGRVAKKQKKASLGTPPISPPVTQGSSVMMTSSITEDRSQSETFGDQLPDSMPRRQSFPREYQIAPSIPINSPPASTMPHTSPPRPYQGRIGIQQQPLPGTVPNQYNNQAAGQPSMGPTHPIQVPLPHPQPQPYPPPPSQPASYSSRIEDVVISPHHPRSQQEEQQLLQHGPPMPGQQYIRSQYITATQSPPRWRGAS